MTQTTQKHCSLATTLGMKIEAEAEFMGVEQKDFAKQFTFSYRITMTNEGDKPAQLQSRHWIIIDGNGHREDVHGPGVVGEYPRLEPGQSFSYVSYAQTPTTWGTMEGSYLFKRDDGESFDAQIARFYLITKEEK